MHENGSSEEADSIVARFLPKHRKSLCDRGRHVNLTALYGRVQIVLDRVLLLCTVILFVSPAAQDPGTAGYQNRDHFVKDLTGSLSKDNQNFFRQRKYIDLNIVFCECHNLHGSK